MFKKLLIMVAMLTSASLAYANGYVGADIGSNYALFKNSYGDSSARFGALGAEADIFGGFGKLVGQNTYLGGEIFATGYSSDVKAVSVGDEGSLHYKTEYSYGASLIPGVMISQDTMAFARLGIVRTSFKIDANAAVGDDYSKKELVNGGRVGLGLQTHLNEKMDLRGEYDYTAYDSFKDGLGDDIKPSSGQVKVGLVYRF